MGIDIRLPTVSPQPHTHLAFEGFQFARSQGKGNQYNSRLLRAFFQEDQDIGKLEVLTSLAGEVGLDENGFRRALETRQFQETHRQALEEALRIGITGVPAFLIGKHLLPGVQKKETIERAIELAE